jgi:hypothetical protein
VFRSLFGLILFGSLAIAAYFLIAEHRAHIFGGKWTGPILLLAFVALHLLMHIGHGRRGGHGRHGGGHSSRDEHQPSGKEESDNER